jgi:hypothetical protein
MPDEETEITIKVPRGDAFFLIHAAQMLGAIGWASGTSTPMIAHRVVKAIEEAIEEIYA